MLSLILYYEALRAVSAEKYDQQATESTKPHPRDDHKRKVRFR